VEAPQLWRILLGCGRIESTHFAGLLPGLWLVCVVALASSRIIIIVGYHDDEVSLLLMSLPRLRFDDQPHTHN